MTSAAECAMMFSHKALDRPESQENVAEGVQDAYNPPIPEPTAETQVAAGQ
jgi:hypothetical protein